MANMLYVYDAKERIAWGPFFTDEEVAVFIACDTYLDTCTVMNYKDMKRADQTVIVFLPDKLNPDWDKGFLI